LIDGSLVSIHTYFPRN